MDQNVIQKSRELLCKIISTYWIEFYEHTVPDSVCEIFGKYMCYFNWAKQSSHYSNSSVIFATRFSPPYWPSIVSILHISISSVRKWTKSAPGLPAENVNDSYRSLFKEFFLLFQESSGSRVNMLGGEEEEPLFSSSCRSIPEEELHPDRFLFLILLYSSVADPDPGSGAFLTPGSGMNNPDNFSTA